MTKICNKCKLPKSFESFHATSRTKDGKVWQCKECLSKYGKVRYASKPETWRQKALKKKYGINEIQLQSLLEAQDNKCAICGIDTPGNKKQWNIDHDHKTGQVRGILCNTCNPALGFLQDSPELCRAAADYLERYKIKDKAA